MNLELWFYQLLFIALSLYFCSDKHLKSDGFTQVKIEYKKRGA